MRAGVRKIKEGGKKEEREDKEEKTKLQTVTVTKGNSKKKGGGKKTDATTYVRPFCHIGQYLLVTWTYEKATAFP